jgi:uncharacterized protein (TIGR00266 family)
MNYQLTENSDNPLVVVTLGQGEEILTERGSMVYHCGSVKLEGQLNNNGKKGLGGLMSAVGRSMVSNESMFITKVTGEIDGAKIAIAPCIPGVIRELTIDSHNQWMINDGAFLACDSTVNYEMQRQSLGKAFLGTGGLFVMKTTGQGAALIHSCGDIVEIELDGTQSVVVDNDNTLAWSSSLSYEPKAGSGVFGFTTGEGFVNEFSGHGTILVQTRNLKSVIAQVAATSSS